MAKKKEENTLAQSSSTDCKIVVRDYKSNRIMVQGKGILTDARDTSIEVEVEDEIIQLEGYEFAKYARIK